MRRHFGRFKSGFGTGTGGEFFEFSRESSEQFLFGREHGPILRGLGPEQAQTLNTATTCTKERACIDKLWAAAAISSTSDAFCCVT